MPGQRTFTIGLNTSTEIYDFQSFQECVASRGTVDLVSDDVNETWVVKNIDELEVLESAVTINPTTDSSHRLTIKSESNDYYLAVAVGANNIKVRGKYVNFMNVNFAGNGVDIIHLMSTSSSNQNIINCNFLRVNGSNVGLRVSGSGTFNLINNKFLNMSTCVHVGTSCSGSVILYNNTATQFTGTLNFISKNTNNATLYAKNNLVHGTTFPANFHASGGGASYIGDDATFDYNIIGASGNVVGIGSHGQTGVSLNSVSFVDSNDGDLNLTASSIAIDAGVNLENDNIYSFNRDHNNILRGLSWDVGAFEYVPSTFGLNFTKINHTKPITNKGAIIGGGDSNSSLFSSEFSTIVGKGNKLTNRVVNSSHVNKLKVGELPGVGTKVQITDSVPAADKANDSIHHNFKARTQHYKDVVVSYQTGAPISPVSGSLDSFEQGVAFRPNRSVPGKFRFLSGGKIPFGDNYDTKTT